MATNLNHTVCGMRAVRARFILYARRHFENQAGHLASASREARLVVSVLN